MDSYHLLRLFVVSKPKNKNKIPNSIAYIFNIDVILYSTFICNVFFYVKY